tara:strand:+ start:53 stop:589 length:537 start_codon:yes stop_codon:yes gene_type:complete
MKVTIKGILNESLTSVGESKEKLYDKILPLMNKRPYGDTPIKMGFTKDMIIGIFKRKFGSNVTVKVMMGDETDTRGTYVRVFEIVSGDQIDIYREVPGYNRQDDGTTVNPFWEEWKRTMEDGNYSVDVSYVNSLGRKRYRNSKGGFRNGSFMKYDTDDGSFKDSPIDIREDEFFNTNR